MAYLDLLSRSYHRNTRIITQQNMEERRHNKMSLNQNQVEPESNGSPQLNMRNNQLDTSVLVNLIIRLHLKDGGQGLLGVRVGNQ